jgi:hypothetical protein
MVEQPAAISVIISRQPIRWQPRVNMFYSKPTPAEEDGGR